MKSSMASLWIPIEKENAKQEEKSRDNAERDGKGQKREGQGA